MNKVMLTAVFAALLADCTAQDGDWAAKRKAAVERPRTLGTRPYSVFLKNRG